MKVCTKCGTTKPLTEFSIKTSASDGLQPRCKVCNRASFAVYRATNLDKVKVASANYYAANTAKCHAANNKWLAANPEKAKAKNAKWCADRIKYRAANPEKAKARIAKWRAENPVALRIYAHTRRARERGAGGTITKSLGASLFKLQRGKCACGCGKVLGDDYHLDHIMPLALGGTNTDDNIQLLTATCNLKKGAKHPVDFMRGMGFLL